MNEKLTTTREHGESIHFDLRSCPADHDPVYQYGDYCFDHYQMRWVQRDSSEEHPAAVACARSRGREDHYPRTSVEDGSGQGIGPSQLFERWIDRDAQNHNDRVEYPDQRQCQMPPDWSSNHFAQSRARRGNTPHPADTVVVPRDDAPMPDATGSGYTLRHQRHDPSYRRPVDAREQAAATVDADVGCEWLLPEDVLDRYVEERDGPDVGAGDAERIATGATRRSR